MKALRLLQPPRMFVEIGRDSVRVLAAEEGLDLPLERSSQGRLSEACKQAIVPALRGFVGKQRWPMRPHALCAIAARGVSLRRLLLPASSSEDLSRLLLLQIESEFPLPPDELAWGACPVPTNRPSAGPAARKQEFVVVAARKQVVEEYAELLVSCGMVPSFTLAALARSYACPAAPDRFAVLDVGRDESEWAVFEEGCPSALRLLPWGLDNLTRPLAEQLGLSGDEAERLSHDWTPAATGAGAVPQAIRNATDAAVESLVTWLAADTETRRVYLTGNGMPLAHLATALKRRLGDGFTCEPVEAGPGAGRSVAVRGLRSVASGNGGRLPVSLQTKPVGKRPGLASPAAWKWLGLAAGLALLALALPYAEAVLLKPHLTNQLAAIKSEEGRLSMLDRELGFLRYLKQSQPPYLEALYVLANSVAPGSKLELVSLNRRGDVALRGYLRDAQQVLDFRSKLIDSGVFSNVAVEEQTPTPDRQRVLVRITAQWKPGGVRDARPRDVAAVGGTNSAPGAKSAPTSAADRREVQPGGRTTNSAGPTNRPN